MPKFRYHRGGLAESMETVFEVANKQELIAAFDKDLSLLTESPTVEQIKIEPYGYDERIGWNTHIVTIDGFGPIGFTDGMID